MISLLPKLGDRNFILAFVVPSLLFMIMLSALFMGWSSSKNLLESTGDSVGSAAYFVGAIWLLAIVLATCNLWIYRILEGVLPPVSWLLKRKQRYKDRVIQIRNELQKLNEKLTPIPSEDQEESDRTRYQALYSESVRYPARVEDIKPTSFGNIIISFESYPTDVYGADGAVLWPRLLSVVTTQYAASLADARSQVDFFINCTFFSALILSSGFFYFLYKIILFHNFSFKYMVWSVAAALCSWIMYKTAVASVPAWGNWVKAGFDCYLPDLAKQLGFELPTTDEDRRKFWQELSAQAEYRRKLDGTAFFKVEDWSKQTVSSTSHRDE